MIAMSVLHNRIQHGSRRTPRLSALALIALLLLSAGCAPGGDNGQTTAASPALRQDPTGAFADLSVFQEAMRATFQQHTSRPWLSRPRLWWSPLTRQCDIPGGRKYTRPA